MGTRTDFEIAEWQKQSGIEPATGKRAKLLRELSAACFEAIKIIELEASGIRDGAGFWDGSDVIGHTTGELVRLCEALVPRRSDEEMIAALKEWACETALWEEANGCGKSYDNDGNHLPEAGEA